MKKKCSYRSVGIAEMSVLVIMCLGGGMIWCIFENVDLFQKSPKLNMLPVNHTKPTNTLYSGQLQINERKITNQIC